MVSMCVRFDVLKRRVRVGGMCMGRSSFQIPVALLRVRRGMRSRGGVWMERMTWTRMGALWTDGAGKGYRDCWKKKSDSDGGDGDDTSDEKHCV